MAYFWPDSNDCQPDRVIVILTIGRTDNDPEGLTFIADKVLISLSEVEGFFWRGALLTQSDYTTLSHGGKNLPFWMELLCLNNIEGTLISDINGGVMHQKWALHKYDSLSFVLTIAGTFL